MRREEKDVIIDDLAQRLNDTKHFYLTDISSLNAEQTSNLRRKCFEKEIGLLVVKNTLLRKAMEKSVKQIVDEVKSAVEQTPPELLADVMVSGIQMSGGGALLRGLDTLIQRETKIPTKIIEDPMTGVVRGAGMVLENLNQLREVLVETEYLEPPR